MSDMYRIVNFFSENAFSFMSGIPSSIKPGTESDSKAVFCPRVQYGRLVLRRARWAASLDRLPRRHKKESQFLWYERTRNWFADMGLPSRGFYRFRAQNSQIPVKPAYLDLDNVFTFLGFMRQLRVEEHHLVVVEEVLPQTPFFEVSGCAYPCEIVLESNLEAW